MDDSTRRNLTLTRLAAQRQSAEQEHRGGYREGAGRKPLSEKEATESHAVTMPASYWQTVKEIGNGQWSAGLRKLVEFYRNR